MFVAVAVGCGRAAAPADEASWSATAGVMGPAGATPGAGVRPAPVALNGALRFDWTPPLRAHVTEVFEKKGHKGKLRYDLVVTKAEPPAALRVASEGFRFEEIDGPGAGTPEVSAALAAIGATMMLPTLSLTREGAVLEVGGLEKAWEDAVAWLEKSGKTSPTKAASIRKLLEAPEMRAALKSKAGDAWSGWIGLWRDMPAPVDGRREGMVAVTMPDGSEVKAPIRYEEPVASTIGPGLWHLAATSVLEGAAARDAMARSMKRLAEVAGGAAPDKALDFRREMHAEVDTDPRTLRPRQAKLSVRMVASDANGRSSERSETSDYTFEWLPAGQ